MLDILKFSVDTVVLGNRLYSSSKLLLPCMFRSFVFRQRRFFYDLFASIDSVSKSINGTKASTCSGK
jgi:hypothetical protein